MCQSEGDLFERKSAALDFVQFEGSQTFDRIAVFLEKVLANYVITGNQLVATVTDKGELILCSCC